MSQAQELPYHSERILLKPRVDLDAFLRGRGSQVLKRFSHLGDIHSVSVPKNSKVEDLVRAVKDSGLVFWAEPDYRLYPTATPNDPLFSSQWGLSTIQAPFAWDIIPSAPNVVVAVLDTGIRYTHQDLAPNMWQNPYEIPGNGIDDDGNGYIDGYLWD